MATTTPEHQPIDPLASEAKASDLEALLAIRVSIRDRGAIERLRVDAVLRYLAKHRWHRDEAMTTRYLVREGAGEPLGSYWRKGKTLLLVPAADVADRIARLAEVVETLAAAERRGQLLVYRDLLAA